MTPARLVSELATAIKKACAQVRLPLESEEAVAVEVFTQYLPEDLFETTRYLPFALVELLSIKDDFKEGSRAEVGLTLGIYAPDADAWLDGFHLMEVIRQEVLTWRVVARRFRLLGIQWELPETQPRPFFYATGQLTFDIFQAEEMIKWHTPTG